MARNARQVALSVLSKVERSDAYASIALDDALQRSKLSTKDRALATELVYGSLRHAIRLDETARRMSKTGKLDPLSLRIVRLGLYQLAFLDRIPEHAAVHDTVGAAPGDRRALINALLRRFIKDGKQLAEPGPGDDPAEALSLRFSHQKWFVQYLARQYGLQETELILDALNANTGVHLRANDDGAAKERLIKELGYNGLKAKAGRLSPTAVRLDTYPKVGRDDLYRKGAYTPQDEAAQYVVHISGVKPGMKVLDLCAAPGNKTTALAQAVGRSGSVLAIDIHPTKLKRVDSEIERLGLKNVRTHVADATDAGELKRAVGNLGPFDLVLVDAPCSGLGTTAKAPELKIRRTEQDLRRLADLQLKLLANAVRHVGRPGGLVFSVCTLSEFENRNIVDRFLAQCTEIEPNPFDESVTKWDSMKSASYAVEILPHRYLTEGFFIARFKRS